jgi:hypothetical protein
MSAVLESDCLDFLLKDSRFKAAAVASGSWFHNRIVDGKKDFILVTFLFLWQNEFDIYVVLTFKTSILILLEPKWPWTPIPYIGAPESFNFFPVWGIRGNSIRGKMQHTSFYHIVKYS